MSAEEERQRERHVRDIVSSLTAFTFSITIDKKLYRFTLSSVRHRATYTTLIFHLNNDGDVWSGHEHRLDAVVLRRDRLITLTPPIDQPWGVTGEMLSQRVASEANKALKKQLENIILGAAV
jgi:hypothetical protein